MQKNKAPAKTRAKPKQRTAFDNPANSIVQILNQLQHNKGYDNGDIVVDSQSVLGIPAIFRAARLIGSKVGGLPVQVHREGEEGREQDKKHQAYRLLRNPNPNYGRFTILQTMTSQALVNGNSYARLDFEGAIPTRITLLDNSVTSPFYTDGELYYRTKIGSVDCFYPAWQVLHCRNLTRDGVLGISICDVLKEALGVALSHTQWECYLYKNGCSPGSVIEFPGMFGSPEELAHYRAGFDNLHAGSQNAGRPAIIQGGGKFTKLTVSMEDQQFLESKEFDLKTVSNITGVPAHFLGSSVNASYSSLESESQAFLDNCLSEWLFAWEEELNNKLRKESEKENDTVVIEFQRAALTRADLATENKIMISELQAGTLTLNEYRKLKNRPLYDSEIGDRPIMQSGFQFIEDIAEQAEKAMEEPEPQPVQVDANAPEPQAEQDPEQPPQDAQDSAEPRLKALLLSTVKRLFKRVQKSPDAQHRQVFVESLSPAIPDIETRLDAFLAQAQADPSLLDNPEQFLKEHYETRD